MLPNAHRTIYTLEHLTFKYTNRKLSQDTGNATMGTFSVILTHCSVGHIFHSTHNGREGE